MDQTDNLNSLSTGLLILGVALIFVALIMRFVQPKEPLIGAEHVMPSG